MMNELKVKTALKYCFNYKDGFDISKEFITPSFIAVIAAFIKSQKISKEQIKCKEDNSYLESIGFYNELWGTPITVNRHSDGFSYSPLILLDEQLKTNDATSTINSCIKRLLNNKSSCVNDLCEVVGELHDNVWAHGKGVGFSIAQYYRKPKRIEFAVVDCGIGFFSELKNAHIPKIENHKDAIQWCLQRGNSSKKYKERFDDGWGQRVPYDVTFESNPFSQIGISQVSVDNDNHHEGLGLAKLVDLIKATNGNLQIISGNTLFEIKNNDSSEGIYSTIDHEWKGVIIAFSIPTTLGYKNNQDKDFDELLSLMTNN